MDTNEASFAEFAEAFDEPVSNQTEETEVVEEQTDAADETAAEEAQEPAAEGEETPEEGTQQDPHSGELPAKEETFTLKVNKEERTYSRDEVISLAQKGADYDRVKEQLQEARQKMSGNAEAMSVLEALAKESGIDVPALLTQMQIGLLKKQEGLSDTEARERLLRQKAEKENESLKAAAAAESQNKETSAQRAQREIEEFRAAYPDTELSKDVLNALMPDVQKGMPLIKAYQKRELAQKDAQIAQLQQQLAAQKQNKANAAASPGSQSDSGGRHSKNDYDDFMAAFA